MKPSFCQFLVRWAACIMILGTQGCRSLPAPNPGLDLQLTNVQFLQATALETTALVTVRLSNESPDPIQIRGAVHELTLNNIEFGKILSNQELELAPFSHAPQELEMHLSHLKVLTRLQSVVKAKQFEYRLQSRIYLKEPRSRISITESETLNLQP